MKACWDLGDIISVSGFVFKTRRGEISVHAKEIKLLSKSLLPLPEKFHGLKDTDLPVPPALCGLDRQSGGQGYVCAPFPDCDGDPQFPQ